MRIFSLITLILNAHLLLAQSDIPIGSWRTHFSYQQGHLVCLANDKVYCATQNGLFYYDKETSSVNVLSKLDGLSDAGVVAMDYQEDDDLLILAYQSNVIDVLASEQIASYDLLQESGSNEQVHEVLLLDNVAYLATSLGVRVIEIDTEEGLEIGIRESYTRLSDAGETLAIYDIAILRDSIYLATDEGIIANSLDINVNLQDFASWRRFGAVDGLSDEPIRYVEQNGSNILVALDGEGVYAFDGNKWQLTQLSVEGSFSSLYATTDQVLAVADEQIYILTDKLTVINASAPSQAMLDTENVIWLADENQGLVKIDQNGQEALSPSGPQSDNIYSIHYVNGHIISLLDSAAAGFSIFEDGRWRNFSPERMAELLSASATAQLLDIDYLSADQSYYFASFGDGLIQWDGEDTFSAITSTSGNTGFSTDDISSVLANYNQLWLSNYYTPSSIHLYDSDESNWQSFTPGSYASQFPIKMELIYNDMLWFLSNSQTGVAQTASEVVVYDATENTNLLLRSNVPATDLPGSIFTDITVDRDGQLWLTGNEGVSYFPVPGDIFSYPTAIKPVFENQYLLYGEYISSIAVDGGNRKWMGSQDGVWLFNETGEELIHHFVSSNSPLPSDNVLDISVDDESGEVFFLTDRGMVSYRATSTVGAETQQAVKIFPNPVPANFDGQVGIEGLVTDANVKITTISGTLVRELEAEGGTAIWDIRDYHGSRVGTGVYLVFSASADGSQTFIAKVAVIN